MDILKAYQQGFERLTDPKGDAIIGYVHDDLICHESVWKMRVLAEFLDPSVVLVGFAGATGHGQPWMYSKPFSPEHIPSMVRLDFRSNLVNAEQHGTRLTEAMNAAVLDGMAIFVRREFLAEIGGWPGPPISYFMYTEWLCCMARRCGRKIRVIGVECEHLGGKTSGLNPNLNPDYIGEHQFMFENFRDVFPWRVNP